MGMLAGIIIAVVVCAGLAFALPWVTSQRPADLELEGDPTERFADSMRILRRDVEDYVEDEDLARVSTPLTRRAELNELRLIARQAAKRRLTAPGFLELYKKALKPGGEIHFKTDNRPLFEYSLEQFEACGWLLSEVTGNLHENGPVGIMTDYEAKFHAEGVPINRCVAKKPEDAQ